MSREESVIITCLYPTLSQEYPFLGNMAVGLQIFHNNINHITLYIITWQSWWLGFLLLILLK